MAVRTRFALLTAALVAACSCAAAGEAEDLFRRANGFMLLKEYDLAVERYTKLLDTYPGFKEAARALHRKAYCLHATKRYAAAEAAFRELLRKHADFADAPKARYLLGDCCLKQDKKAEGAKALLALAEKHPTYDFAATALYRAGEALYKAGSYADAAKAYAKLIADYRTYRHMAFAHYSLGWCRVQLKDHKAAVEAFGNVVADHPESRVAAESQYRIGEAHLELKAYDSAIGAFDNVLKRFPGEYSDDALLGKGRAYYEQKEYAQAAEAFLKVARQDPPSPERPRALYDAANSLFCARQLPEAEKAYDQAIEGAQAAKDTALAQRAVYARGHCYLKAGKAEKAMAAFTASREAEALAKDAPRVVFSLGDACFAAKRYDEAAEAYAAVVDTHADSPVAAEALSALAFCRHDQGKLDQAIAAARKFVQAYKPEHTLYKDTLLALADFQFAARRFGDAKASYEQLNKLGPPKGKIDWTLYRLGWCHRNLKEPDAAVRRFTELHKNHRQSDRAPEALCLVALIAQEQKRLDDAAERYAECFTTFPDSPYAAQARFDLGVLEYNRRNYAKAARHLEAFLAKHPDRASVERILAQQEKPDQAARALLALVPKARLHLAEAVYENKKHETSLAHFRRFLQENPKHELVPRAHDGLAWTLRDLKQLDAAVAQFLKLADEHPKSSFAASALFNAATIRQEQERHDEAQPLFARFATEFPKDERATEAAYRAASALSRAGKYPQAALALQAFLDKHGESKFADHALYDLAWTRREQKRPDDMVAALERLVADHPKSNFLASAHFLLGEHHFEAKNYAKAAARYTACAETAEGKELAKALYKLAWSHVHAADREGAKPEETAEQLAAAVAAFDALLARVPDTRFAAEAHYCVGTIHQRQSQHPAAIGRFRKALAAAPAAKYKERALYEIGQSHRALGKWADALESYKETLASFPTGELHLDATYGLGLASQHLGAFADAQDAFRKVVAASKAEVAARAQYGLGECQFLQGNYKAALAELLAVEINYAYEKWRAAALLKAMECYVKLAKPERVRFYYGELARKFPKSDLLPEAKKLLDALPKQEPAPKAPEPAP